MIFYVKGLKLLGFGDHWLLAVGYGVLEGLGILGLVWPVLLVLLCVEFICE